MTVETKPNMASIPAGDEPQAYVFGPDSILLDYTGTYVLIDGCSTARSFVKNVNKVSEAILSNVNEASLGCISEQVEKDVITYSALPNLKEAGLDGSAQNLAHKIQKANENAETKLRFNPKYEPVLIDKRGHSSVKIHVLDGARKESLDALDKALTNGSEVDLHRVSNQHGLIFVLVWSSKFNEPVKRVLYSGNAPYDRIIQALEKASSLNVITREVVTPASMIEAPIASGVSKVKAIGSTATPFSLKDKIEAKKRADAAAAATRPTARTSTGPAARTSTATTKAPPTRTSTSTLSAARRSPNLSTSSSRPASKTSTPSAANPSSRLSARSTLPPSRPSTTTKPTTKPTTTPASSTASRTTVKKTGPPSTASTTTKTATARVPSSSTVPGKLTRATAPKASHPPARSNVATSAASRAGPAQAKTSTTSNVKKAAPESVEDSIVFVGEYITIEDTVDESRVVLNEKDENRMLTNMGSKGLNKGSFSPTDINEENMLSTNYAMNKEVSENPSLLCDEQAISNQVNEIASHTQHSEVPSLNSFETEKDIAEGAVFEKDKTSDELETTIIELDSEASHVAPISSETFTKEKSATPEVQEVEAKEVADESSITLLDVLESSNDSEIVEIISVKQKDITPAPEESGATIDSEPVVSSTEVESHTLLDFNDTPNVRDFDPIREDTVDSTSASNSYKNPMDISDIRSTSMFNDTLGITSFADPHNEAIVADSTINGATILIPQIPDADGLLDHIEEPSVLRRISMDTDTLTDQLEQMGNDGQTTQVNEDLLEELSRQTVKEAIEKAQASLVSDPASTNDESSVVQNEHEKDHSDSHQTRNEMDTGLSLDNLTIEEQTRKISQHLIDSAPTEIATALAHSMMEGMQNAASHLASEENDQSSETEKVSTDESKKDASNVDKMLPMQSRSSVVAESDDHEVVYEKPDPIMGDILETVAADSERVDNDSLKSSDPNLINVFDATNVVRQYWTVTNRGNGPHLKKERYFELATVPHNGSKCSLKNLDEACNYFHSIRSKNYILASEDLPVYVLEGWLEAKKGWGNPDMATSLILTVSANCLTTFTESHAAELAAQHMSIPAPITNSHITVQYETGQERFNIIRLKL
ncbi:unnamed protein product [Auanema sp. JU1783]|nr:unnamed protein product [Auanema sp. JU1783]